MNDSILTSIKKLLGIVEDYEHFDADIIMHINSVFVILYQLGFGEESFSIEDKTSTWSDYIQDEKNLELIKSYVYKKVQKMFDPPTSSIHMDALDKIIAELEWRINIIVDTKNQGDKNENQN